MTTPTVISGAPPLPTPLSLISPTPTRLSLLSPALNLGSRPRPHLRCKVALRSDAASASISDPNLDDEVKSKLEKVGSKVRVKAPMKVYHIPRLPQLDLTPDMEGVVKQYVGFWKGKRITANYPFKVEFSVHVEGRGMVKFFAHLKEDEFDFLD